MHVYTMLQEQVNSLDCRGMLHENDTYWYLQYIHPHLQFTKSQEYSEIELHKISIYFEYNNHIAFIRTHTKIHPT